MSNLPQGDRLDRRAHVDPELSEERLSASWARVRAGRDSKSRKIGWAAGALVVAAAAGVLLFFSVRDIEGEPTPIGTRVSTAGESVAIRLADGSRIEAEPHTNLSLEREVDDETLVSLEHGGAEFDVAHDPSRHFVVAAGAVRVHVVGTRFTVRRRRETESDFVEVEVERGVVEVEHGPHTRRLEAGMVWSTREQLTHAGAAGVEPEPAPDVMAEPPPPVSELEEPAPPATEPPEGARPASEQAQSATPVEERPRRMSAGELLERATAARRDGDARLAAQHYATLVRMHPRDARAGLAAFELGRLRMDLLHDPRGAARAFRDALRIAPASPFREDAMARLVRAHEAAGQASACAEARDQYLAAYPGGRHAVDVRRRCQ